MQTQSMTIGQWEEPQSLSCCRQLMTVCCINNVNKLLGSGVESRAQSLWELARPRGVVGAAFGQSSGDSELLEGRACALILGFPHPAPGTEQAHSQCLVSE